MDRAGWLSGWLCSFADLPAPPLGPPELLSNGPGRMPRPAGPLLCLPTGTGRGGVGRQPQADPSRGRLGVGVPRGAQSAHLLLAVPLGQLAACLPRRPPTLGMGLRVWAEPEGKLRLEWGQPPLPLASLGRSGEQALDLRPRIRAGSHSCPPGTPSAPSILSADPPVLLGGQSGSWKTLGASRLREGMGLPRARGTPAGSDWQQSSPWPCQNWASPWLYSHRDRPGSRCRVPAVHPVGPWLGSGHCAPSS